jgi:glycosyltransferase involved in cell wall biosynthesis
MTASMLKRVCILPRMSGVGGMVSFRAKFAAGLVSRGIGISNNLTDEPYDAVLVIGGTRQLAGLWRARKRGIPIVQRLDGFNWLHKQLRTGVRHFLRAEWGNWVLSTIRARLANEIVYQSEFVRDWWERAYGAARIPHSVVLNGVDLNQFTSNGPGSPPEDRFRILLVEGTLGGGYEMGLDHAVGLVEKLSGSVKRPVELMVVGRVADSLRQRADQSTQIPIIWSGKVPAERIPEIDRSAHVLFSADLHPACPNAVIEALACGLPVAAFNTGALPELVTGDAGRLADYGGDPWKLEPADIPGLARAAQEILENQARFRNAARKRAEQAFSLQKMIDGYIAAIEGAL